MVRSLTRRMFAHVLPAALFFALVNGCAAGGREAASDATSSVSSLLRDCVVLLDGPGQLSAARCFPDAVIHEAVAAGDRLAVLGEQFTPPRPGASRAWPMGPFSARLTASGELEGAAPFAEMEPSPQRPSRLVATYAGDALFVANVGRSTRQLFRIGPDGAARAVSLAGGIALARSSFKAFLPAERDRLTRALGAAREGRNEGEAARAKQELADLELTAEAWTNEEPPVGALASSASGVAVLAGRAPSAVLLKLDARGNVQWGTVLSVNQGLDGSSLAGDVAKLAIDQAGTMYVYQTRIKAFSTRSPLPASDVDYFDQRCFSLQPRFCLGARDSTAQLLGLRDAVALAGPDHVGGERLMARWFTPAGAVLRTVVSSVQRWSGLSSLRYAVATNGDLLISAEDYDKTTRFLTVCRVAAAGGGQRCAVLRSPKGKLEAAGFALSPSDEVMLLARERVASGETRLVHVRLRL